MEHLIAKPSNNLLESIRPGIMSSSQTEHYSENITALKDVTNSTLEEGKFTLNNKKDATSVVKEEKKFSEAEEKMTEEPVTMENGHNENPLKCDNGVLENTETDAEKLFKIPTSPTKVKPALLEKELVWDDDGLPEFSLRYMDVFRKSKKFCDLILRVGGTEIYCHRIIVGGASKAVYQELMQGEQDSGPIARITVGDLHSPLNPEAVEQLVDYIYTSKLVIPTGLLTAVYKASLALDISRVTPYCRNEIIKEFDVNKCVSLRRLAQNVKDRELLNIVDSFIEDKFDEVTKTNEFLLLPRIKIEMQSVQSLPSPIIPRDHELCILVLQWIHEQIHKNGGHYIEDLTEQVQRVTLEDLNSINSSLKERRDSTGQDTLVNVPHPICPMSRSTSMDSLSSTTSNESTDLYQPNGVWSVLSHTHNADHLILFCCLGDVMATASIRILSSNGVGSSASSSTHSCASSVGSVGDLAHLSQARCAAGVVAVDNHIYVLGGFNQSDCLDTVECFDPITNHWTTSTRMPERRARFGAATLNDEIYAVGGSTGSHDQCSVNRYNVKADKWSKAPPLPIYLSGTAVAVVNNLLYCVGGVQQNRSIAAINWCYVFDPVKQGWNKAAPLNTGRSFAALSAHNGSLYCAGGTDGWKCLATVERFENDKWTRMSSLNMARKGAGMASHNDFLFVAGGSNSSVFLQSIERMSRDFESWTTLICGLTIPRSNVGLVSTGSSLYAVGGYSGRNFLSSVEAYNDISEMWTTSDHTIVFTGSDASPTTNGEIDLTNENETTSSS